ncbi:ABC transporter substrate-binding protein [Halorussus gelatinilyticus]|uniref:ABC transporter substrate-binding protein n=1 Tax=Halorussus gelatinilyticus TaxID=2937524 RepID=A0A8U0IKW3_9EURY|nr:ABC transporter substrate-binding protein [Halorussus gelatinilyticus]UPW00962.1 ABC transporter substrate-binding protein [Halorussus gelatinilyticus]
MAHDEGTSRRKFLTAAGAAAATASVAGCTGGGGSQETTTTTTATDTTTTEADTQTGADTSEEGDLPDEFPVTITQGQMPTTLDPQNHRSTPTDNVVLHAYEGLLGRDQKGKVVQKLATNYERQEPGRVRFQIREGVTFHNGDQLTPEDVAFSINRIVKKNVSIASPQADQLAGVTGAKVVDGQRAVDVMSEGINPIVFSLFATYCDIMQKSWVQERSKSEIAQQMNGTGPFKLEQYQSGVQVEFSRYEDYWRRPPAITTLTFRAAKESSTRVNQLLEGETDIIVNVPPQSISRVRNAGAARISAVPSTRIIYNAMKYNVEPFSSPKFRRAMNYAVDLQSIIQNVLSGFADPTSQPTLEGFFGYNPQVSVYPHNKSKAEQLVEESGHAGASITLHTPVGRYLKDVEIAQAVANQIDQLSNVSCSVKQREFATLAGELTDGNIDTGPAFYLIGWGNATFDASQTIIPLLTSDGALTSYSNEKVDNLIDQAQSTGDSQKRDNLLRQANQILHDQAPWIYLNRQYSVYGVRNRVEWQARRDERIDAYAMEPAEGQ